MSKTFQYQEPSIHECAQAFTNELIKLHTKMDWSPYKESTLTLKLEYTHESGPKVEIRFSAGYGEVGVSHSALGPLMDEVYRRLDYQDRAEIAIQRESNTLQALPAPEDLDTPSED